MRSAPPLPQGTEARGPSAPPEPPAFAWRPLLELPGAGGERAAPVLRKVTGLFLRDAREELDAARRCALADERDALAAIVHRTKSAAAAVGALRLAALAGDAEARLRAGAATDLGELVARMAEALALYRDAVVREGLGDSAPGAE